jgi:hypothetical protein
VHLRRARDLMDREYARPLNVAARARAALMSTAPTSPTASMVAELLPDHGTGRLPRSPGTACSEATLSLRSGSCVRE